MSSSVIATEADWTTSDFQRPVRFTPPRPGSRPTSTATQRQLVPQASPLVKSPSAPPGLGGRFPYGRNGIQSPRGVTPGRPDTVSHPRSLYPTGPADLSAPSTPAPSQRGGESPIRLTATVGVRSCRPSRMSVPAGLDMRDVVFVADLTTNPVTGTRQRRGLWRIGPSNTGATSSGRTARLNGESSDSRPFAPMMCSSLPSSQPLRA